MVSRQSINEPRGPAAGRNGAGTPQALVKPVSDRCNLACGYCFYRGKSHRTRRVKVMPPDVIEATVGAFMGLGRPLTVFSWQGGEPTLAGLDFFREVVRLQARLGSAGQAVGNSLQTNGLLLDRKWASFLAEYRFLAGLSLDGPREVHDAWRRSPEGGGSHAGAMRAAALLRRREIPLAVLAAVRRGTTAAVYTWFREQGFDNLQFIPVVERGGEPGSMAAFTMAPGEYGEFLCRVFDLWWPERLDVHVREFHALAARLAGRPSGTCHLDGTCDSYLVVEADGGVYPCDFFVRGELRLGDIRQGFPRLAAAPAAGVLPAAKARPHAACRECRWLDLCRGGCPKDRERAGDIFGLSYLCESYRIFLRHAHPRLRELAGAVPEGTHAGEKT